jgi:hypothetical protein
MVKHKVKKGFIAKIASFKIFQIVLNQNQIFGSVNTIFNP